MKKIVTALAVAVSSVITASSAIAGPATDPLATCLADNTTGRDRKDIARWVYVGMSIHPEINNLSNVTDKNREEVDRKMAAIFIRLMTENCLVQAKSVMDKEGGAGFQTAFGTIGRLAMRELLSNPSVNSSFDNFTKYIDQNKFNYVFEKK